MTPRLWRYALMIGLVVGTVILASNLWNVLTGPIQFKMRSGA